HELLLDLLPEGGLAVGEAGRALGRGRVAQRLAQLGGAFAHAHVVVLDALARQLLDAVPVARFEQRLGTLRAVAEQRIVAVEPGQDLARHGQRLRLRGRSLLDALDVAAVDHGRGSGGFGEQLAPDQHAADLAGARADLVQLGVAPQAPGGILVDVAIAAEYLHALAGHP